MMPAACTTPLQPKWPNVPVFCGMNGTQLRAVDVPHAEADEQDDHGDLDRDDDRVEARGLLDADVAERGDRRDDQHGRQVDDRARAHDLDCPAPLVNGAFVSASGR